MVGHKIQGCRAAIGFDTITVPSCRVLCLGICNKMKPATCYRTKLSCMRVCGESLHGTNQGTSRRDRFRLTGTGGSLPRSDLSGCRARKRGRADEAETAAALGLARFELNLPPVDSCRRRQTLFWQQPQPPPPSPASPPLYDTETPTERAGGLAVLSFHAHSFASPEKRRPLLGFADAPPRALSPRPSHRLSTRSYTIHSCHLS